MIGQTTLTALDRRGADRHSVAAWQGPLLAGHPHAILAAMAIVVFLLVLLFASVSVAQVPSPAQPAKPAAMELKMGEMKLACAARHEAAAIDIQALTSTVTAARTSNDVVVLRAALDATLRHLEDMRAKAATCAAMMNADAPAAASPKSGAAHEH